MVLLTHSNSYLTCKHTLVIIWNLTSLLKRPYQAKSNKVPASDFRLTKAQSSNNLEPGIFWIYLLLFLDLIIGLGGIKWFKQNSLGVRLCISHAYTWIKAIFGLRLDFGPLFQTLVCNKNIALSPKVGYFGIFI